MSKFQVGDRVRALDTVTIYGPEHGDGIKKGAVYTVDRLDESGDPILNNGDTSDVGWGVFHFELYAKAGEFVVGDVVVGIERACQMRPGDLCKVLELFPATSAENEDISVCRVRRMADDEEFQFYFTRFRLATSEEIAAAELAAPKMGEGNPSIVIEPNPFGKFFTILGEPDPGPQPIPAADFDFSTIKAGDAVDIRFLVEERRGDYVLARIEDGSPLMQFRTSDVSAVIPTPKTKTLRERAIEAAYASLGIVEADES